MDSFTLMRAFRRIVERGSLARAAEDLGLSPAGLSKQLRTLETHLGVVLLQRTTRRMSLTETGHAYYRECCRLLDELDALERGIAQQRGEVSGRLRVNAPQSLAAPALACGELQQVLPDHRYPPRFVYAVYPTARHLQPKVRTFIDFLHAELPACAGLDS
ncbi:LysR family transcriptional regulator|nr:LysR family transcriptional regulator [Stenotrophomonas sp. SbOxS2]